MIPRAISALKAHILCILVQGGRVGVRCLAGQGPRGRLRPLGRLGAHERAARRRAPCGYCPGTFPNDYPIVQFCFLKCCRPQSDNGMPQTCQAIAPLSSKRSLEIVQLMRSSAATGRFKPWKTPDDETTTPRANLCKMHVACALLCRVEHYALRPWAAHSSHSCFASPFHYRREGAYPPCLFLAGN